jgi:putative DNA-binding protein
MMTEQPTLGLLQHWMKTVVTERGSLREKLQSAAEQHGLSVEQVVAEKRGLSIHQRLSIYTSGYVLRLLECMRADFPALRNFVGDSVFDAFAKAYIINRPPQSRSLFDLSAGFPQFLEETKPKDRPLDAELSVLLDLPPELARLERARADVMRAHGTENDPPRAEPFSPLAIFSQDVWLEATPCLRLLELKFPLVDFLRRVDQGERPEPPTARASFVALGRSNYRPNMEEVALWQFAFLKACERPLSLYSAAQRAAVESGRESASVLAELVIWLPVAIAFGFLRQVS